MYPYIIKDTSYLISHNHYQLWYNNFILSKLINDKVLVVFQTWVSIIVEYFYCFKIEVKKDLPNNHHEILIMILLHTRIAKIISG